ncbi:MAG: type III pantothenate kinase [Actinobacteria bacterium]|nr:MAG: type III pantothenate kinase [Actinomycetota bacterium]
MLCAIDVGNTQTVIGLFEGDRLEHDWRVTTAHESTADEMRVSLADLLALEGRQLDQIDALVVSSVVPNYTQSLKSIAQRHGFDCLIVGPTLDLGLPVRYEPPTDVGADRLVNAVAALSRYGSPTIVVDFGTATTFDAITADGEYAGGVIAPGVEISADALFSAAAKLSRVDLETPSKVIGTSTATSVQSGVLYGQATMVDGLVDRMKIELGGEPEVISTGGFGGFMTPLCERILHYEPYLTLEGLNIVYQRNR